MTDLFDRFTVIDVDTHLTEPPDVWTARMPAAMHERVPHIERVEGQDVWMAEGQRLGTPGHYSMAGFDGVRGWIYHLAVAPECRRRGFATQLVRAAGDGLRKLGCQKINLQVRATNDDVVAFYRTLGYEVEQRVSMGRRF